MAAVRTYTASSRTFGYITDSEIMSAGTKTSGTTGAAGPTGATGPQGFPCGPTGPQGSPSYGATGSVGITGPVTTALKPTGPTGPRGSTGVSPQGKTGPDGLKGATGTAGSAGSVGERGPTGDAKASREYLIASGSNTSAELNVRTDVKLTRNSGTLGDVKDGVITLPSNSSFAIRARLNAEHSSTSGNVKVYVTLGRISSNGVTYSDILNYDNNTLGLYDSEMFVRTLVTTTDPVTLSAAFSTTNTKNGLSARFEIIKIG